MSNGLAVNLLHVPRLKHPSSSPPRALPSRPTNMLPPTSANGLWHKTLIAADILRNYRKNCDIYLFFLKNASWIYLFQ